jgi:hypothetical protein
MDGLNEQIPRPLLRIGRFDRPGRPGGRGLRRSCRSCRPAPGAPPRLVAGLRADGHGTLGPAAPGPVAGRSAALPTEAVPEVGVAEGRQEQPLDLRRRRRLVRRAGRRVGAGQRLGVERGPLLRAQ